MFGIENYWLFVLSGVILNITPGADTMYIVTRSVAQGRNAGIISVLGIASGCLLHTLFAAFGLTLILATSHTIFKFVQYLGALYLIYLGVSVFLRHKDPAVCAENPADKADLQVVYLQGVLTNLLNPKVALFFLSFLPQFIDPAQSKGPVPFLLLGGTFLTTGTLWCLVLACAASWFTRALRKNSNAARVLKIVSGIIFIGLGLNLAFRP